VRTSFLAIGAAVVAAAIAVGVTLVVTGSDDNNAPRKAASVSTHQAFRTTKAPSTLFASDGHSGTLVPVAGSPGEYTLTVKGVHPNVLYFLDRPGNEVGAMPLQRMLDSFFKKPGVDAPNAAINAIVPQQGDHQSLMGVKLLSAKYDAGRKQVTYRIRASKQGPPERREHGRTDVTLPASFMHPSLYIDDGGNTCSVSLANYTSISFPAYSWTKWPTDDQFFLCSTEQDYQGWYRGQGGSVSSPILDGCAQAEVNNNASGGVTMIVP
jgi:hypothetical protein